MFFGKKKSDGESFCLLTLVLVDESGEVIEFKTWREEKAYCVYRKVQPDICYEVTGSYPLKLHTPNPEFSTAKYETTSHWRIDPMQDLKLKRYLNCSTTLNSAIRNIKERGSDNVLGVYLKLITGPCKYVVRGKPLIQGYWVKLADDSGRKFLVLVWHSVKCDRSKFSLFNCEEGDTVLIPCARPSCPPRDLPDEQHYTLTSIYQPVVDSDCVSNRRKIDLIKNYKQFNYV